MTLEEVDELCTYWLRSPPAHISLARLAAGMVGWKPEEPFRESSMGELAEFAGSAGLPVRRGGPNV